MVVVEKLCLGKVPTVKPDISGDFSKLMSWADKYRKLKVRTNSETPLILKLQEILELKVLVYVEQNICFLMKKELFL